jgi:hypothetical protein
MVRLAGSAIELVAMGKREPDALSDFLQSFVFGVELDFAKVYGVLGMAREYEEFAKTHEAKANPSLWIVPVVKGVTCNKVVQALRKLGIKVCLYVDDLYTAVPKNDRDTSKGSYIIGFARNVEADEENKGKSARKLAEEGHKGITFLERLLLELAYFLATGKRLHLDVQNITMCAGSRDFDGHVPSVYWHSDLATVYVNRYDLDDAYGNLRSRSAVSYGILPA